VALAGTAFLAVLILRLPAQWFAAALPQGIACQQLEGTLWSGACAGMLAQGRPSGDLAWRLHPLALLLARLSADVVWTQNGGTVQGSVQLRSGDRVSARDVQARMPLTHDLLVQVPAGWSCTLLANLPQVQWNGQRLTALEGRIELDDVKQNGQPLGAYRVSFPPEGTGGGDLVGALQDLSGPVQVDGTLRLKASGGWTVDARVRARPGAPPQLANSLRYLGAPDGQGRYPLTLGSL